MTKCLVICKKIVALHKHGLLNVAIAKRLLESKTTVGNIVRHLKLLEALRLSPCQVVLAVLGPQSLSRRLRKR